MDERNIMKGVTDIMQTFKENDLTPAESILLQKMLTGEPITDARLETLAAPIRQAIDQFGQEAVDLGLLSAESFDRNRGAYLHRVYQKHETDQKAVTVGAAGAAGLGATLGGAGARGEVRITWT